MTKRCLASLTLALACVHCGGSESDGGSGGSAGSSGGGGAAGSGGSAATFQCAPNALAGPIADGQWDERFTVAGVAGPDGDAPHVADFARDVDGTVLAAGRFRWLASESVEPLLRAQGGQASGGQWQAARETWELEPPEFGGLSALAVGPAGELALATTGLSPEIWIDTGQGLQSIAKLSDVSSFHQYVRSLAWYGGELWAAGSFAIAGTALTHLARWDGVGWAGPPNGAADAAVYELMVSGSQLFVAGLFDNVGGIAARRVAAWDGASWQAFDMDWPQANAVFGLATAPSGKLVAGGSFSDRPEGQCPSHGSVAEWDGAAWQMLGGGVSSPDVCDGSTPGWVYDIAFHEGDLYVTGSFTHANGPVTSPTAIPVTTFARWKNAQWESLDSSAPVGVASPWVPLGTEGFGISGQRLFSDGDRLLAGFLAPGAAGVPSQGLIAYQAGQWVAQGPTPGLGLQGDNAKLAVGGPGCALHALGNMTHTEGRSLTSPVLRFDSGTWTSLGGPVPESLQCDGAIAVDAEGTTFIACVDAGGGAPDVLRQDGTAWTSLGPIPGPVKALTVDARGVLWAAGGNVGEVSSGSAGFVARYEDGAWKTLAEANGVVSQLDFAPDDDGVGGPELVIGGSFTQLDGAAFARVAHWDGTTWTALGVGLKAPVSALEYGRHGIYASEESDGVTPGMVVGRWDGSEWTELATAAHEFPTLVVTGVVRLLEVGESLIVAGTLLNGEFPPQERMVVVFDGARFSWLGGGLSANFLRDAAVTSDALWFGGAIAEAGVGAGRVSSVGIARYHWQK